MFFVEIKSMEHSDHPQGAPGEGDEREQARQELVKRLVQAQEDERRSIALELHDELGQSLMAVLLDVHGLRRAGEISASAAERLEAQLQVITDEVRAIARRMRPALLDDGGLEVALESYLDELQARSALEVTFHCGGCHQRARLPSEIEITLFRIAQESLTNVLRHASAGTVTVVLSRTARQASLLVQDDGGGFDTECWEKHSRCNGLGLMGMRERAALVGGSFSVASVPGRGTTVLVTIPANDGRL